jgi:dolichol-phosphate mannosyltransferase
MSNEPIEVSAVELSIVLPAYEEGENLERLLPKLQEVAGQMGLTHEILVVDTETPHDATPDVCSRYGARYVPREGGSMYGNAVSTGIARSQGRHVLFMDADGSHNPGFIPELWKWRADYDLVIASRYAPGGKTENPRILILMSHVVNVVFRLVLGLRCLDVSNSFRLYRGEDLRKLRLECQHFDIVEEILVKLVYSRENFRIKETPSTFEKRKAGKTKRQLVTFALGYIGTLRRLLSLKRKIAASSRKS